MRIYGRNTFDGKLDDEVFFFRWDISAFYIAS